MPHNYDHVTTKLNSAQLSALNRNSRAVYMDQFVSALQVGEEYRVPDEFDYRLHVLQGYTMRRRLVWGLRKFAIERRGASGKRWHVIKRTM